MKAPSLFAIACLAAAPCVGSAQTAATPSAPQAQPVACAPEGDVAYVCGFAPAEDLVQVPNSHWLVASSFRGKEGGVRLLDMRSRTIGVAYPSATAKDELDRKAYPTCPGPLDAEDKARMDTHGVALDAGNGGRFKLYVVHHGKRESIEVFDLDVRGPAPALTWIGCVVAPDPIGLNSVAALPDGGFITTNFQPRGAGQTGFQKMSAGEDNGELWEWHAASGWVKVPGGEGSGINGVLLSNDLKTLYAAGWGSQSFFRLTRGAATPKRDTLPLGFRVDNLRYAPDGAIFVAGQTETGSRIVKIDPKAMKIVGSYDRPTSKMFEAGTAAVEADGKIWVGSYRSNNIAVFPTTIFPK